MAPRGPMTARRGPKSSSFVGVKKRGGNFSVDMRCGGRRWEVSGFASDEHAGLAHDIFRLLDDKRQYVSRRDEKLNFPLDRALLIPFSIEKGMATFRVVAEEEEKSWSTKKKEDFMQLVEDALCWIKPKTAEDSEGAKAATAQSSAANYVQVSNDDMDMISGDEENNWEIEKGLSSDDPSSYNRFNSRVSERDIYPGLKELEKLLLAEKRKNSGLENQNKNLHAENKNLHSENKTLRADNKSLQAENKGLNQQLAGVGGQYEEAGIDVQVESEDARGRNTGRVNTLQEGCQFILEDFEPMSNAEYYALEDMANINWTDFPTEAGTETVQTKPEMAEDFEGAEAATTQSSAANFVQVSNDDMDMISGGEGNNWEIEKGLSSDDPSSLNRFNSRASERDMYPDLKELAEKEKNSLLENQNKGLNQQLAAGVGGQYEEAGIDAQAESEDARGRNIGWVNTLQEGCQFILGDFESISNAEYYALEDMANFNWADFLIEAIDVQAQSEDDDFESMSNLECDLWSWLDFRTDAGTETVQTV